MIASPLVGVRVKIDRAKKHVADLETAVLAFKARDPHGFTINKQPDTGYELYCFEEREAIPREWGAIVGDCIHNLRSALDLLANALVIDGGGKPGNYTAFPISSDRTNFETSGIKRADGASPQALAIIKELKPYYGGNDTLWRLHQLNIADKHRLLIPVAARTERFIFRFDTGLSEYWDDAKELAGAPIDRKFPLKNGDQLLSYKRDPQNPNDKSYFKFTFEIAFGEGQSFDGEPLIPTLGELIKFTEQLVDGFARGVFNSPW